MGTLLPMLQAPPARPTGYRRVLAVPEFRVVFAAHALSLLGVVVTEIALSVLVYDLTGSPLMSALAFAVGFLPYLIGGTLLAGVADRYPARRVLVVCDLVCAACVAAMVTPGTGIAVLLLLRCALAVVSPVFAGTRMATLVDVLGDGDLFVLGRSLLRIVSQSALLVGYGLGGLLLTVVSPRHALLITVGTFLTSAALLRLGTRRRPARASGGAPCSPTPSRAPGRSSPTAGCGRCSCCSGSRRCSPSPPRPSPPPTRPNSAPVRPGSGC